MTPEAASHLALIVSVLNSVVGLGVFIIHCKGDKERDRQNVKKKWPNG